MKNLYDTIEQNLKAGLYVVVKGLENNNYSVISNSRDHHENYRTSAWWDSIEEAKQWIGSFSGESKEYWDDYDLEIVEVFRPEYEPFKVGDKVRLLDSIKKTENWKKFFEDENRFPDMTGKVEGVCFDTLGTHYSIDGYYIGHEYLAPLQEDKEEIIKIGDHIYSKSEVENRLQGLKEI